MIEALVPKRNTLLADRYLLQEEIGSGGTGNVYRATDLRTGGLVAVKLLHPGFARNAVYRERLRREAQIAAAITSPRVVRVVDLDEHDGVPFLVQEYVAGETLGRRLEREGVFPLEEALAIASEVARALTAAHDAGIVHRDLKPENIKLVDGQVKVLDFGIARASGIPGLTASDSWVGTVEFAAPERAQGLGDIRSDVYSLGVILFLLVTGQLPFPGPTPLAILRQHESAPPPIPGDLPPEVQAILARCLAKQPDQRYPEPADLVTDLEEALAHMAGAGQDSGSRGSRGGAAFRVRSGSNAGDAAAGSPEGDTLAGGTELLPAARAGYAGPTPKLIPPTNLPMEVTSFVGRERESAEVLRLISAARALTLTGPGGIGKTRLALRVAAQAAEQFLDGAWLVSLAAVQDGGAVAGTIAGVLGVREAPDQSPASTLTEWLRSRRLLLVLDNCEHLVAACATLVDTLLQACPHVHVLATSREPLGIVGEVVWRVPPLDLDSEAVQLFADRAAAARPGFQLGPETEPVVAAIGFRLDGLPLAIELAASRAKVLSVGEIAARLHDRFRLLASGSRTALPHQQTLRAAMDWSYDLLSPVEQTIFRRLGVFARGFTIEAVEAVIPDRPAGAAAPAASGGAPTGAAPEASTPRTAEMGRSAAVDVLDVLDGLAALVDKSLLTHESRADSRSRYAMLQTIREYGLERLRSTGEEQKVADRHLDYCVQLTERAEQALRGRDQLTWLAQLDDEQDNLRAVLDWCADGAVSPPSAAGRGLRVATALGWYWYLRGQRNEGRSRLERLLQRVEAIDERGGSADAPRATRALARAVMSHLAFWGPDPERSVPLADEACRLARETGDQLVLAWCLLYRAVVEPRSSGAAEWAVRWEECLALFRAASDNWGVALSLCWLGHLAFRTGDSALAIQHLEESQSLFRLMDDRWGTASVLARLASVAEQAGDLDAAEAYLGEQQALARDLGHQGAVAGGLDRLAELSLRRGDVEQARERFEQSLVHFRAIGEQRSTAAPLRQLARLVAHHDGDHRRAEALLRESLLVSQNESGVSGTVRSLLAYADLALLQQERDRAARLLAAVDGALARGCPELDAVAHQELEQEAAAVRRALLVSGGATAVEPLPSLADAVSDALRQAPEHAQGVSR